jgi:hypothetical protein
MQMAIGCKEVVNNCAVFPKHARVVPDRSQADFGKNGRAGNSNNCSVSRAGVRLEAHAASSRPHRRRLVFSLLFHARVSRAHRNQLLTISTHVLG